MNEKAKTHTYKVPPQEIESEKALLGSIMLKPEALNEVIDIVSTASFYVEKHRMILESMLDLYTKNEPIDLLSLSTKLKDKKRLDQVGGGSYLA